MTQPLVPGVPVWFVAAALPIILVVAWGFSAVARLLVRGRIRLSATTSIVISILGSALGLFLAGWIDPDVSLLSPLSISAALGTAVLGVIGFSAIAAHVQRPQRESLPELVRSGESDRVEFKSTARVNLRTSTKDGRMEHVIAKTVAAFLNAAGGTLVIGVDDTGTPLGLEADLATLKAPDLDHYELWLRDLLTASLGQNAAGLASVEFGDLSDSDGARHLVCRVTCQPSPRPVYLRQGKGAPPEFWMRSGNSTRHLTVDEATEYVMHRWPLNLGSTMAAQLRAVVRFSEVR